MEYHETIVDLTYFFEGSVSICHKLFNVIIVRACHKTCMLYAVNKCNQLSPNYIIKQCLLFAVGKLAQQFVNVETDLRIKLT